MSVANLSLENAGAGSGLTVSGSAGSFKVSTNLFAGPGVALDPVLGSTTGQQQVGLTAYTALLNPFTYAVGAVITVPSADLGVSLTAGTPVLVQVAVADNDNALNTCVVANTTLNQLNLVLAAAPGDALRLWVHILKGSVPVPVPAP